jgi:molybdopterin-guanine dinucleotide biosynthesis protein A
MSADGRGSDKGMVTFRGRPLVQHVVARLRPQVKAIVLNANPESPAWKALQLPILPDLIEGRPGPLAGIHAAMTAVETPWLLTVPCDTPCLPDDLLSRLANTQRASGASRVSVRCGGQRHPIIALLRTNCTDDLYQYLASGGRRIESWLMREAWVEAEFEDEIAFSNLNTAEELRRLEASE